MRLLMPFKKKTNDCVLLDLLTYSSSKPDKNISKYTIELKNYAITLREATKNEIFNCKFLRDKNLKITSKPIVPEIEFGVYHPEQFEVASDIYISGYFQSEKYFSAYRGDIINNLTLKIPLDEPSLELMQQIKNSISVSLHIRRGDYLNFSNIYHICSIEYYKKAVDYISNKIGENITVFVFSDDIAWARENLNVNFETIFVDFNNNKPYFDMELMRNCKHNITANSTFSWWGAWLNENKNKIVIAPQRWFNNELKNNDIVPQSWIKIDS